jgi:hypothetical protein
MAIKNGKTRKVESPYEVWSSNGWTWKVLKFYSNNLDDEYARVFCHVDSPYASEMGDVYYNEIRRQADLVYRDSDFL